MWNNFNFYHNVLLITILNCFPHQSLMETHTDISTIHILAHKPPATLINIKRNFSLSKKKKKNLINCFGANLNFSIMALSVSGLIFFFFFFMFLLPTTHKQQHNHSKPSRQWIRQPLSSN